MCLVADACYGGGVKPNGRLAKLPTAQEVVLMRRIFVVLTLGTLITGLVAAPTAAKAEVETFPFQFISENPCTGEHIEWTGTATTVSQDIENANGRHFAFHTRLNVFGTGLQTGDTYRLVNSGTNVGNEVFIEGEYVPSES
jgi:hypothetical protein